MSGSKSLRASVQAREFLQAPGAYDALTAKIIENEGFDAVYMTGYGTAASFGLPNIGLLTMTEMVGNAGRIADAVEIPVIADADTGYGNPINVVRTVKEYEKAGVAAIHIEDQHWPKRCGHMSGKRVIPAADMVEKIRAAVDARKSEEFLIIARTDAIATDGFEAAIERGAMYAEAGADVLFVEAPTSVEQMKQIPGRLAQVPNLVNLAPRTPNLPAKELAAMGFTIAIYPGVCMAAAVAACTEEVKRIKTSGSQRNLSDWIASFAQMNDFLGESKFAEMEQRYKGDESD